MSLKAIREKFIYLKPFKYQYKLLITGVVFLAMIVFELFILAFTLFVPHFHNGYYYFFKGGYHLLITSRDEPNSCQGFIFMAVLLGYVPSIITFIVGYFIFAYWLINEVLPRKQFIVNWHYTSIKFILTMAHITIITALFTTIPAIAIKASGYSPKPWECYELLENIGSEVAGERATAVLCFLYFAIGCPCLIILTAVVIGVVFYFIFKWIFIGIGKLFSAILLLFRSRSVEEEEE